MHDPYTTIKDFGPVTLLTTPWSHALSPGHTTSLLKVEPIAPFSTKTQK